VVTTDQHTLTPREAARYLGISDAALRLWRSEDKGPRYFKAGEKLVRYRRTDLDAWIEERLSTTQQEEVVRCSRKTIGPCPVEPNRD
jgi:excisionase family DNA binding protein